MSTTELYREAASVAGCGPVEERLIRLMIWVGTTIRSTKRHSRLENPLDIWMDGTAWCDQHCRVFCYFVWALLGLRGRQLAMTHANRCEGHTVCEIFYGDKWHLFDPHTEHLSVYRASDGHIMSYEELTRNPQMVKDQEHWWRGSNGTMGKEGFYSPGCAVKTFELYWSMNGPAMDPPVDEEASESLESEPESDPEPETAPVSESVPSPETAPAEAPEAPST